jgi:hypothetical protein
MARYTIFREASYTKDPERSITLCYAYAGSTAAYLVQRFGMQKNLELCRKSAGSEEHLAGVKLAEACRDVYGISIESLEADWRRSLDRSPRHERLHSQRTADADIKTQMCITLQARIIDVEEQVAALKAEIADRDHRQSGQQSLNLVEKA